MITPFEIVIGVAIIMFLLGIFLAEEVKGSVSLKIGDDWRLLIRHAWSVRLVAIAAILSGCEVVLPIVGYKLPVPDVWLAVINFVVVASAFIARFIVQEKLDEPGS